MAAHITRMALVLVLGLASVCNRVVGEERAVPERAVSETESDKLLPATTGYVLLIGSSGITAIRLPDLQESNIPPAGPANPNDTPTIHALSGPDAQGRIAYIEDHFFVANLKDRRHLLKTIQLDGTKDTELFSRPGDAMWAASPAGHGEVGRFLALSPIGGRVAFVTELTPVQMPSAYLHAGTIEIWNLDKKAGTKTKIEALDEGLAWFPDGKRLAYVKLVDPTVVADSQPQADTVAGSFKRWNKIPAVFIRDVDAGTESFLHAGLLPVVSFDGKSVLVGDLSGAWVCVDVATGKSNVAALPGVCNMAGAGGGAVANPIKDVVLSWCLPTKGAEVKHTENNSPLRGPKEMLALKLVRVNSGDFQTVVPYIDPRTRVSFGEVKGKEEK